MDGDAGEELPLLERRDSSGNTGCLSDKLRLFCTLGVVILFFKGGEGMCEVAIQQYMYLWCKVHVNSTLPGLAPDANTVIIPKSASLMNIEIAKARIDGCGTNATSNNTIEHRAQTLASRWELYFSLVNAVILFCSLSLYGTLSDYVGRKPFVCLSLAGYVIKTAFYMIIIRYNLHISYMLVSIIINALCGSNFAFRLLSYTMTADLTNGTRERVLSITIMEILISIGRCTTQFGNGYFIRDQGYFYPMLTAFCAITLSLIITVCFLKETRPSECNTSVRNNRQYILKCSTIFKNYFRFYFGSGQDKKIIWICLSVFFFLEFGEFGHRHTLALYQLGSPFCWGSRTIGFYNGARILVCYVMGGMLLKPIQTCLSDDVITCLGLVSAVAFNMVTALARSTTLLFIAIPVGFLMDLPKSILRGLASSRADAHKQGAMFSGFSSMELVCQLIASPASLALYSHTLNTMKGAVFLALAGANLVALIIMVSSLRLFRNNR